MKHLKTYEKQNTKNWYSILINKEHLELNFNKLIDNQVEDAKFFDVYSNFIILAYLSKKEHKKNFKNWVLQTDFLSYLSKLKAIRAIEFYDIEKYIEKVKIQKQASKYNI